MTTTEQIPDSEVTPDAAVPFNLALSDEQKEIRDWAHGLSLIHI